MPDIDESIVVHKIVLSCDAKLVKQKIRKMNPKVALLVKAKIEKLLKAGFIFPIDYSPWISNTIPVRKPDGRIYICIDFWDVNKSSLKDEFPLPNINMIMDSTARYALLSFMDGFSGYNQIRINPEDQYKTTFTTPWGTFCYVFMPFGLKNIGATYQWAMTLIFHDFIHKVLEDYVDDILVKSLARETHIENIRLVFERLRLYKMRLNPLKCVFGVDIEKLLGFTVSHWGIKIDTAKIDAIVNVPLSKNIS